MGYLDHEGFGEVSGYTYDPKSSNLRDRLRLELGDTDVSLGAKTAVLSDDEYEAILMLYKGKSFNQIKIETLEIILNKLSYETNFSIDGMSYSLSDRIKHFENILERLKKTSGAPPTSAFGYSLDVLKQGNKKHYFHENMQTNDRRIQSND